MSTVFLFGEAITYEFYPAKDNEALSAAELAAITLVNVYVFNDSSRPTVAQAQAGTNAVQGPITSWTGPTNGGFTFAISPISDPDQAGGADIRDYWVGINFRLAGSAQVQTAVELLQLRRVDGHHSRVSVDAAFLKKIFPTANILGDDTKLQDLIDTATNQVQIRLEAQFLQWLRIDRLDRLNYAVAYKALANGFLANLRGGGDRWKPLYDEYKSEYDGLMATLRVEYDKDGDKIPDEEVTPSPGVMWINLFDKPTKRNSKLEP